MDWNGIGSMLALLLVVQTGVGIPMYMDDLKWSLALRTRYAKTGIYEFKWTD